MRDIPLVSVAVITYNQEKYIRQTLDGIIMQHCNFEFNIIIGDDCSTDSTTAICRQYEMQYPAIIKLLKRDKNLGLVKNYSDILAHCNGKYIAQCAGDDYWTDSYKLQKQVDFMENNLDYSLCFHNIEQIFEGDSTEKGFLMEYQIGEYQIEKIWEDWVIQAATILFRSSVIKEDNYLRYATHKHMFHEDVFLLLSAAEKGKFYGLEEVMSVYRKQEGSLTAQGSSPKTADMQKMLNYINLIGKLFGKYRAQSNDYFSFKAFRYAYLCKQRGLRKKAIGFFLKSLLKSPRKFYILLMKEVKQKFNK